MTDKINLDFLKCCDCGSTEIYTHANTGGKEIQFPKSIEPSPFTIDEGKNQWGDYDMYCPTCDFMDYTKPVDATQNEIDLELIAAAPDLLQALIDERARIIELEEELVDLRERRRWADTHHNKCEDIHGAECVPSEEEVERFDKTGDWEEEE